MSSFVFILFVILVTAAIVWFRFAFNRYRTATKELCFRLDRTTDPESYFEIQKKLRCLKLSLIPFVNDKNAEAVYSFFYPDASDRKCTPNPAKDSLATLLAPSIIGTVLCLCVLGGSTYAWFVGSVESGQSKLTAAYTDVEIDARVNTLDGTVLDAEDVPDSAWEVYSIPAKTDASDETKYLFTLTMEGTATCGYCYVEVDEVIYVTETIDHGDSLTFTLPSKDEEQTVRILSSWGLPQLPTVSDNYIFP